MVNKKINNKDLKKVVAIGGGTGNFVVLSGLKKYPLDLTAIVSVADSGGSTGRLRTEFGFLPVGDMRQCLAALAKEDSLIKKILLYRFAKGRGLKGHNLGNLILTALTDLTQSEPKAVEKAAEIFNLSGRIIPITLTNTQLVANYQDGKKIIGEHKIDQPKHKGGLKIIKLANQPSARIYKQAQKAILNADLIILGPGDLYTSIIPNLIVQGVKKVFSQTKAKVVYIVNLMTRFSQTANLTADDHVQEIKKYLGRYPDYVLINNGKIPQKILTLYQKEKGYPVKDDLNKRREFKTIRKDLVAPIIMVKPKGDVLQRSYLRHDSTKLAKTIVGLLK
jgi:uncharacterized cofD-like protein